MQDYPPPTHTQFVIRKMRQREVKRLAQGDSIKKGEAGIQIKSIWFLVVMFPPLCILLLTKGTKASKQNTHSVPPIGFHSSSKFSYTEMHENISKH